MAGLFFARYLSILIFNVAIFAGALAKLLQVK